MTLLPARPPLGRLKVTDLVFAVPQPAGAVPLRSVSVTVTVDNVCVGSERVILHDSMCRIKFAFPLEAMVMGAFPVGEGIETEPPAAVQYTIITVLWFTSSRAEIDPSFLTDRRCVAATFSSKAEGVEVAG